MKAHKFVIGLKDPYLLENLSKTLNNNFNTEVKTLNKGVKMLRYILREQPQVAIIDYSFDDVDFIEIEREIRNKNITTKLIVLFSQATFAKFLKIKSLNISGCLSVDNAPSALVTCVKTVLMGNEYLCDQMEKIAIEDNSLANLELLSVAELTVLTLVPVYNNSNKIAAKLKTSVRTIEKHRSNIIKKLDLREKEISLSKWALEQQGVIQTLTLQKVS